MFIKKDAEQEIRCCQLKMADGCSVNVYEIVILDAEYHVNRKYAKKTENRFV